MKNKILVVLVAVVSVLSAITFAANIYINTGKVIPGKITSFDGSKLTFILPGADVSVSIETQKIVKISFDNKTDSGTGLILKNGVNLPYAQLAAIRNGKAFFSLPFGALEVNDLSSLAFVNFKNVVDLSVPNPSDFIIHPVTGGEFTAKLVSVENGVYKFKTKYGDLSMPWSQIKDMEKDKSFTPTGNILLPGEISTNGEIASFDGTYYTLNTSYGQFKMIDGTILAAVNPNPVGGVDFSAFLKLRNGQVITGTVSSWNSGKIKYATPWGNLEFSEDDVAEIQMEKTAGIHVVTTPSGADVQLDGVDVGKTPLKLPMTLSGMHELIIFKPGYQILDEKIYATPYMSTVLNYDLKYGDIWEKAAPMPTARSRFAAVEYEGKIYAIGGYNDGTCLSAMEVYDPKTNKWTKAAPMPTARDWFAAVVYQGKIYAIGGENRESYLSTVEVYDPKTNKWTKGASLPIARRELCAVVYDGEIYVIGGYNNSDLKDVEIYNSKSNSWSKGTSISTPRRGMAAIVYKGKIYIMGGYNGSFFNIVEAYDSKTNRWTKEVSMPTARNNLAAVSYGGEIYAIGGNGYGGALSNVEIYDPKTRKWVEGANMSTAKWNLSAVTYNDRIYILGGENNGKSFNTVEVYIPGIKGTPEKMENSSNATTNSASSTNKSVNTNLTIITPVTVGFYMNEKNDLTVVISNGSIKKTFTQKDVPCAKMVAFKIAGIPSGTYNVVATWGKHTASWTVNFENQAQLRFMMR
ncbi:Kelch repeat-containing protein [Mesoaciditoga lauensis]|uniref:Kelch repeat-containing protein n=1 Tax=Mesoaciditoga lauensis TaxID=1495039 RepID=UPI00068AB7B5|nr:kelch repeat-containing protein [Mesoaciditoga lauensis]